MYVNVCKCMYLYSYVCMCMHMCAYACMHACLSVRMHIHIFIHMRTYKCLPPSLCLSVDSSPGFCHLHDMTAKFPTALWPHSTANLHKLAIVSTIMIDITTSTWNPTVASPSIQSCIQMPCKASVYSYSDVVQAIILSTRVQSSHSCLMARPLKKLCGDYECCPFQKKPSQELGTAGGCDVWQLPGKFGLPQKSHLAQGFRSISPTKHVTLWHSM